MNRFRIQASIDTLLGQAFFENLFCVGQTRTAFAGHAKTPVEFLDGRGAIFHGLVYLAFGDAFTDTDVHDDPIVNANENDCQYDFP